LQCLSLSLSPTLDFDKVQYGKLLIIELLSAFNFSSEISADYLKKLLYKPVLMMFSKKNSNIITLSSVNSASL